MICKDFVISDFCTSLPYNSIYILPLFRIVSQRRKYSLSDKREKNPQIFKFLSNFVHMRHPNTNISTPPILTPPSASRARELLSFLFFLKEFLAFPRPHQIRVTLRQLFHGEHEWLTSYSDVSFFSLLFFRIDYKAPNFEEGWRMNYILGVSVAACICAVFLIVLCTVKLYTRNNPSYRNLQSATK